MRLRTALPLSLLLLSACGGMGGSTTLQYTLDIDNDRGTRATDLTSAAARVLERRLGGLKQDVREGDVTVQGDTVTVRAKDQETADALDLQLQVPFAIEIMLESDAESADTTNDVYGAFKETGIVKTDFDWVRVKDSSQRGKTAAEMTFTPEGQAKLKDVFAKNPGKRIGIFLRGNLMSLKVIDAGDADNGSILVDNIPDAQLAAIFADDVNVGLHVTFTRL